MILKKLLYICSQELLFYILKMLSRKVEGIDPTKPWQPLAKAKRC